MKSINIWIVKGLGQDNPEKLKIEKKDTVGTLREKYSEELGVGYNNIELSTEKKVLTDDSISLMDVLENGETLNVLPRARAGN